MKKGFISLVVLVFLTSSGLMAQTDIGLKGIGGKLGLVIPEGNIENTIGFGAVADLGTVEIADDLVFDIHGYLDYWGKSYSAFQYYEWSWSVISLAAIAKYNFEMEADFIPYAGAGLGFDFNTWKSEYDGPHQDFLGDADDSETDLDFALHLVGGATYPVNTNLDAFGEVKYTTSGGADYFGLYVGVIFKL